jgi:cytochrome b6-f complex iron-sulfur subunit
LWSIFLTNKRETINFWESIVGDKKTRKWGMMLTNSKKTLSRRIWLNFAWQGLLAVSGLLAGGGLLRFLSYQTGPTRPTRFELGPVNDYPPGSVTPISAAPAIVWHSPNGLVALSAVCPHLGCQVEPSPEGFECPCHASRFDPTGVLQRGPASQSLKRLRLEITIEEQLILYLD